MNVRSWILLVCMFYSGLVGVAMGQTSPPPIIEKVAHMGDPAPGLPGFVLDGFNIPQIDGEGNLLFLTFLDGPNVEPGNGRAILHGGPDSLQKLLWESEQAPDMPEGVIITDLLGAEERLSEDAGSITVTLTMTGPGLEAGVNDRAFFVGPPGDIRKVLQGGDQAPGCEPGVFISCESPFGFGGSPTDNGHLWVVGDLAGPGVVSTNNRAHWLGTRDSLGLVWRKGMQAPGLDQGVTLSWIDLSARTDAGVITFRGSLSGPGVTTDNNVARYTGEPGSLQMVARKGDPVPGMGQEVTWKTIAGGLTTTNVFGDLAEVGIMQGPGVTEADDYVLFTGNADELDMIAREGDLAPEAGPDVWFSTFGQPWVNNRSEMFYRVKYAGPGIDESNKWAMYYGPMTGGELTLREGVPAPSFSPDIQLASVNYARTLAAMNDAGDIVTGTEIRGPGITDDNKIVLWFRHRILERWVPLVRGGDSIGDRTVRLNSLGELSCAYFAGTGGADGRPQSMNDLGMLAVILDFTDGTEGIHRISPPVFGDANCDGQLDGRDIAPFMLAVVDRDAYEGQCPDCDAEAYCDLNDDGEIDSDDVALLVALLIRG